VFILNLADAKVSMKIRSGRAGEEGCGNEGLNEKRSGSVVVKGGECIVYSIILSATELTEQVDGVGRVDDGSRDGRENIFECSRR